MHHSQQETSVEQQRFSGRSRMGQEEPGASLGSMCSGGCLALAHPGLQPYLDCATPLSTGPSLLRFIEGAQFLSGF